MEVKVKQSGKIEKIEAGCSSTGFIAGGRAYIVGTIGQKTFETFSSISIGSEEVIDIKIIEKSVLFLSKKG